MNQLLSQSVRFCRLYIKHFGVFFGSQCSITISLLGCIQLLFAVVSVYVHEIKYSYCTQVASEVLAMEAFTPTLLIFFLSSYDTTIERR